MHILEIPSFFPPYGGLFCLDQAKALSTKGHVVRILSNVQLGVTIGLKDYLMLPYVKYEHKMDGITVYQSFQRGLPMLIRSNVNCWVAQVRSMFADYVQKYGVPDILHAHCAKWAGYAAMLISEEYKIPYVVTEHLSQLVYKDEFGPAPSTTWQIPLLTEAYQKADLVIHVSKEQVDSLACYFGKNYRWQAISNIIDVDFYHYQTRKSLKGRSFRFCCLANYWSLKGYDVLFEAFGKLRSRRTDVELHIAGKGTNSLECRKQLTDGMTSHGWLDKEGVRSLLYDCDALVLASRSETQGLVLLEAMSTGIPAISTTAIPRSVRIKGLAVVPVDNAELLAEAMNDCVEHPEVDSVALSDAVRNMASPQTIGERLSVLFNEIVASQ